MTIPVDTMYSQRSNFIIVALTGITGSGCSAFAESMALSFSEWENRELIRKVPLPEVVDVNRKREVFKREYALCYNFCKKNYDDKGRFEIVKYRNVLLYCMLECLTSNTESPKDVWKRVCEILKQKFDKSREKDAKKNVDRDYPTVENDFTIEEILNLGLTENLLRSFWGISKNPEERKKGIYSLFFSKEFNMFCEDFYNELKRRDYYAKNFFVHRLAFSFRATGHPYEEYNKDKSYGHAHLFHVVEKINDIIKGCHLCDHKKARRFVIDSIRNSMELLFLRERYNSFYSIALHNDNREKELIREKVENAVVSKDKLTIDRITNKIMSLNAAEGKKDDFEMGKFFSPDISRCSTESELHIRFYEDTDSAVFNSYTEQWMKYISLILRPGIVTPTRDERCMSVAYVAKFNSGCISRQVGCTIVDRESAIQSVGWNDPPSPQLPCNLRDVEDLLSMKKAVENSKNKDDESLYQAYSKFELTDDRDYPIKDNDGNAVDSHGKGFCDCLDKEIKEKVKLALSAEGLHYPYCFRSRYNTYINNKDAVNTRSLHAEENTMLRLAKQGGMGLNGGTMYVTASPCVLCSKKAYQIGIKEIVYLDPYTDIAPDLILSCGYDQPKLRPFMGAIGGTFYKLYQPFMPYKDEITIWEKTSGGEG